MNATLKSGLIIAAKQGVNAALVALTPVIATPAAYNLTSRMGIAHVAELIGGAILSRELMVWLPKALKWSQTTED